MDKRFTDLQLLSATMEQMNEAENFVDVADIIFEFIKNYASYDMAVIYRVDKQAQQLEIVSCLGADINKLKKRVRFKVGEGAVGKVAQNKRPIHLKNALKEESILVRQFYDEDPIIRSFIAVPLIVRGEVNGILSVSSSEEDLYSEYDVKMINIIASQGALLLELNNQLSVTKTISDTVLENINSGVMLLGEDNKVMTFNHAAERITGMDRSDIIGRNMESLGMMTETGDGYVLLGTDSGEKVEENGYLQNRNGEKIDLKVSTSYFWDKKEETRQCVCVFRDNTEIGRLQKQLMVAEKLAALGRLTAGLTHEIRNPLLPISNASEFLYNKYSDVSEELNILLSIIKNESDRLNKLLSQLSALYKNNIFVKGQCCIKNSVDEVLTLLSYTLSNKKINVNSSEVETELEVNMNKDNLKQVIINLMLNAIDAMDDVSEKTIFIETKKEDNFVLLTIKDTGIGIKTEEIGKIFDPFFTTKETGSGIGLSLVFRIMEAVGGSVSVESQEGKGTAVSLKLPMLK